VDDVNKVANASTTAQTQEEIAAIVKNQGKFFLDYSSINNIIIAPPDAYELPVFCCSCP
jgi:hypothetical protein